VGLSFKLAHALVKHGRLHELPGAIDYDLRPLLDLVALGTVADVVPLCRENRILVRAGLARLEVTRRPGLVALKRVARVLGKASTYQVGFQLGPRLNAAGRLETAEVALSLLLANEEQPAQSLARQLDDWNRERQELERNITEEALAAVRNRSTAELDHVLVEGQAPWHIGVVGIVASRVLQEFHRPTIILGGDGEDWRGSGRSIEGFDLAAALRHCHDLLLRHGGHAMAAGLTLRPEQLDPLRRRLNDLARRTLRPEFLQPALRLDAEVTMKDLSMTRLLELAQLEHTGMGNPPVHVVLRGITHARPLQRMGAEKKHAKLWVTDGGQVMEAVLWSVGDGPLPVGRFDLACAPQINEFDGTRSVQLKVLDWVQA
jgi:single-stranded-DNA-specific exonuclease